MKQDHEKTLAELSDRLRAVLAKRDVSEKKMFGGVCFMLNGNMVVGSLRHELLVRIGKEANDEVLARPHARLMEHGGRPVAGYVIVANKGTSRDKDPQELG